MAPWIFPESCLTLSMPGAIEYTILEFEFLFPSPSTQAPRHWFYVYYEMCGVAWGLYGVDTGLHLWDSPSCRHRTLFIAVREWRVPFSRFPRGQEPSPQKAGPPQGCCYYRGQTLLSFTPALRLQLLQTQLLESSGDWTQPVKVKL